jgi:hypothetical protein
MVSGPRPMSFHYPTLEVREPAMNALNATFRKIAGLFIDDGWLAAETLGVVALTAIMRLVLPAETMLAGAMLLIGCLATFTRSVMGGQYK